MSTTTETDLERRVREEQEAHDAHDPGDEQDDTETGDEPPVDERGQTTAFDRSAYEREDLQIPKVDDQAIDRIEIKFTGSIFLDRSDPSDVAVYNALSFKRDVSLLVEAKCSNVAAKGATDRDGDLDVVVGSKTLKVHSLSKPAGADWVTEAGA